MGPLQGERTAFKAQSCIELRLDLAMPFVSFSEPTHLPCPTFSALSEPISQGHYWKLHHKLKIC